MLELDSSCPESFVKVGFPASRASRRGAAPTSPPPLTLVSISLTFPLPLKMVNFSLFARRLSPAAIAFESAVTWNIHEKQLA